MTKMLSNSEETLNSLKRTADEMSDDDSASADPTQEEDSCSDTGTISTNNNKRAKTQEEKRLDRILANRRSARRSRERRKQLQDNLEKSVFLLTKQNEDLTHENDDLKQDVRNLMSLLNEKRSLESSPAPAPPAAACNLSDSSLYQELLLRMAESGSSSAGGNNVISATADRNNSYSTALAASLQNRQLLADLSFLGGASAGNGQQQFYNANAKSPGLIGGRAWDLR
mmetsp:Transcript_19580/g.28900  ORF Transcript_19580/g.28900 Transcript_19580/m.28900 type:complete len:227 (-) Transcript_19580:169-849(-)